MQAQKMAPKIMWIHIRNTLVLLARFKCNFAPKWWLIIGSIASAELAPKIFQIHPIKILVIPANLKYKFAPKFWRITKSTATAEHDQKLAPKINIWISNPTSTLEFNINLSQKIPWIENYSESEVILAKLRLILKLAQINTWSQTNWIHNRNLNSNFKNNQAITLEITTLLSHHFYITTTATPSLLSYKQNPAKNEGQGHSRKKININMQAQKMAPKIMWIHIRNTLVLLARFKCNFAPKWWLIIGSIASAELAPKIFQIHPIKILVIPANLKYKFAPKFWRITKSTATAEHDQKLAPKINIWISNPTSTLEFNINLSQKIPWIENYSESEVILAKLRLILKLAQINTWSQTNWIHNRNLNSNFKNNQAITLEITTLLSHHFYITTTATPSLLTKILMQTFFSMMMLSCTTGEWTNCRRTTNWAIGMQTQQRWQTMMDAAPTPDGDNNREWKGRMKEEERVKRRGLTMKTYLNKEENQKKIIFYIFIHTYSCICNIYCNVLADNRPCTEASKKEIKSRLEADGKGRGKDTCSLTDLNESQTKHTPLYVEKRKKSTLCGKLYIPLKWGNHESTLQGGQKFFYPPCVGRSFCFKLTIFNSYFELNLYQNKPPSNLNNTTSYGRNLFYSLYVGTNCPTANQKQGTTQNYNAKPTSSSTVTNLRHQCNNIKANLQNDIEANPGPGEKLQIITVNCRGLGDIKKFRLLLNKAYNIMQKGKMIMLIQETMITNSRYLDLAWRGKYVFTPGTGSSQGCITLIHNDVTVTDIEHIQNRGHHFKFIDSDNKQTLVVNIYAPLRYNNEKREFLSNITNIIKNHDGDNIVLGGDFNITLNEADSYRRQRTDAEKSIADDFNTKINESNLIDTWAGHTGYTWSQGKIQSRLDRIYIRLAKHSIKKLETNWTLTKSDHAAVILTLEHRDKTNTKNEHVKLDNMIVTNMELLNELKKYLEEQMIQATHMDPHTKLEFAKMTIRTKAIEISMRQRKRENIELKDLNDQISQNSELLKRYNDNNNLDIIIRDIERCKQERDTILQKQGESLSMKAKTRWYNEGERSNKYFLNLLKRNNETSEMDKLNINGNITTDEAEIRHGVTEFYTALYNNGDSIDIDNDFLNEMFTVQQPHQDGIHAPLTLDEMWNTIKPVRATTPGPDGISNLYIKKLWYILGPIILDAWNYSLTTNNLPPSHKTSLLRLIPKRDKDTSLIKNWRPITLSNCDHKLITRLYNNRILKAIENEITCTQTAYIKGRNISDNLRLLGAAVRLADNEDDINATVIALDAQKAFDSVNHQYIISLLHRTGLHNFVPIFQLLYKDLRNDIIINGKIGDGYSLGNGVKQGDALSCSLFILAMEPLLRNISKNSTITAIKSRSIDYTWPKIIGYADDVTIITENTNNSVRQIFQEYERLTKASGLKLNADKTEKFNITSQNVNGALATNNVTYCHTRYLIQAQEDIKINGITFNQNDSEMKITNFETMKAKMDKHFTSWSKRGLSLLGKIQIVKTFGLSQYLYTLAVTDINIEQWKTVNKLIFKFIWNKTYSNNNAPHRIKDETMHTSIQNGGFGMVKLHDLMIASRLRRYMILLDKHIHPISHLQEQLGAGEHLRQLAKLNIDPVTNTSLHTLYKLELKNFARDRWLLDTDGVLQNKFLHTKIKHAIADNRHNSIEHNILRLRRIETIGEVINLNNDSQTILRRVLKPELRTMIEITSNIYAGIPIPDENNYQTILDKKKDRWLRGAAITSRQIRLLLKEEELLTEPKLTTFTPDEATTLYKNISRLRSTQNKTKMLRLLHRDVYCGVRLKEFKLSDIDTCIRCFEKETIKHLLMECPYTQEVWRSLGINPNDIKAVTGAHLTREELEIHADLLSSIIFRKNTMPPNILIELTYLKYSKGICRNNKIKELAKANIDNHNARGTWH
jgi:hypothetical protein